jgi:hypothetical protein
VDLLVKTRTVSWWWWTTRPTSQQSIEVAAKVEHYRPQLAAYGVHWGQVLDREITRGALI